MDDVHEGAAHDIPSQEGLLEAVEKEVNETHGGGIEVREVYINGSYGAQCAQAESDIDITVGITGTSLEKCHEITRWLQRNLDLHDDWWKIDPCVLPVGRYLYGHLEERAEHGGYETIYNLRTQTYIKVDTLR